MSIETLAAEIRSAFTPDLVEAIHAHRDGEEAARWYIGDISEELRAEFKNYPITAIYMAVADEYECSEHTVRDRNRVARHVSQSMRNERPYIRHRMWREIITGDTDELLMQIDGYMEAYGEPPAIRQVIEWRDESPGMAVHVWVQRVESLQTPMEKIIYDDKTPEELRKFLTKALAVLLDYAQRFRGEE